MVAASAACSEHSGEAPQLLSAQPASRSGGGEADAGMGCGELGVPQLPGGSQLHFIAAQELTSQRAELVEMELSSRGLRGRRHMSLAQGIGRAGVLGLALALGLLATTCFIQRNGRGLGAKRLSGWGLEELELQQGRSLSAKTDIGTVGGAGAGGAGARVESIQGLPELSAVSEEATGAERLLEEKKRERDQKNHRDQRSQKALISHTHRELGAKKLALHKAARDRKAATSESHHSAGLPKLHGSKTSTHTVLSRKDSQASGDQGSKEKPMINMGSTNHGSVTREAERQLADALSEGDSQTRAIISHRLTKELSHVISKIVRKVAAQQSQKTDSPTKQQKVAISNRHKRESSAFSSNSDVPSQEEIAAGEEAIHAAGQEASKVIESTPLATVNRSNSKADGDFTADIPGESVAQGPVVGLEYKRIPLTYLTWLVAAMCVVATMLISTNLILKHLDYYGDPATQKYVVRLLFMAPIYAVDSLIALTFMGWTTTYIDVFRDCYEAFTIYNFLKLLIVLLGGEKSVIEMLSRKEQIPLLFPLCYDSWEMGAEVFYNCKYGVLQYVLVKPACALVTFVSGAAGIYGANTFSLARLHFYVFLLSNISQMWALYCLLMFYLVAKQELAPFNPVLKFVIVKAVVFFCFWQGVVLGILAFTGYIPSTKEFSSESLTEAIQELLVCLEMVFISILFHFAFPIEEFVDVEKINELRQQEQRAGLRSKIREIRHNASDPFRVQDVRDDIFSYTNEQQDKFYGAVAATQEGISNVLLSARSSKQGQSPGKPPEMWTDATMPSEQKPPT